MGPGSLTASAVPSLVTETLGFHDLYEHYSRAVYATALRVTGNGADAEDVLQTVFLRVLNQQLTLDPSRSPESYLCRSAANAAIDLLRRKKARPESVMDEGRDYGAKESTALLKEHLRRALAKLPAQSAELFVLCYLEGYSYDELADLLDLERGTVASRLHRIRAALREELDK